MSREGMERAKAVFQELQSRPDNKLCVDCGRPSPQWASVSHGTYLCIQCSGIHRSLGVHISFVRSCTMDSWSPQQLAMMQAGGNAAMLEFFRHQGFPSDLSAEEKYDAEATRLYRARVKAIAEGKPAPEVPKIGYTGSRKAKEPTPSRPTSSAGSMGFGSSSAGPAPPSSMGGRSMQGFGNTPQPSSSPSNAGSADLFTDAADGFWNLAQYTKSAAASLGSQLAEKSKVAATVIAEKSRTAADALREKSAAAQAQLAQKDLGTSVKEAGAKGWSTFSSLLSSAVTEVSKLTSAMAETEDDQPAFGLQRPAAGHSMPHLSSDEVGATPSKGSGPSPSPSISSNGSRGYGSMNGGGADVTVGDEDTSRLKYAYRGSGTSGPAEDDDNVYARNKVNRNSSASPSSISVNSTGSSGGATSTPSAKPANTVRKTPAPLDDVSSGVAAISINNRQSSGNTPQSAHSKNASGTFPASASASPSPSPPAPRSPSPGTLGAALPAGRPATLTPSNRQNSAKAALPTPDDFFADFGLGGGLPPAGPSSRPASTAPAKPVAARASPTPAKPSASPAPSGSADDALEAWLNESS